MLVLRAEGGQAAAALASLDLARLSLGVVAFAGSDRWVIAGGHWGTMSRGSTAPAQMLLGAVR